MSQSVNRKTVNYTIPTVPVTGDPVDSSWYKSIINVILTNLNEYDSNTALRNDESRRHSVSSTGVNVRQLNGITTTSIRDSLNQSSSRVDTNDVVYASDINNIVNNMNLVADRVGSTRISGVTQGAYITPQVLINMYNSAIKISNQLNGSASIWTNSGTCALTCQNSCQVSCQISCQSCHGGTCHAQSCGGGF